MEQEWHQRMMIGVSDTENVRVPATGVASRSPEIIHRATPDKTREVSEDGLLQLQHHLSKATQKCSNRHVHQAMLVLQNMLSPR